MAKALIHEPGAKLRISCASEPNRPNKEGVGTGRGISPRRMKNMDMEDLIHNDSRRLSTVERPVDVLTATPMKVLEMLLGRGWDRQGEHAEKVFTDIQELSKRLPPWNEHKDLDYEVWSGSSLTKQMFYLVSLS